ncbi:MAG: hypothetical protein MZW92_24895 [Comamonadaceae bacterium]|nr:hypothetical protein [Comamonadaceae bacterium]
MAGRERRRDGRGVRRPIQGHRTPDPGVLRDAVAGEQRRLRLGAIPAPGTRAAGRRHARGPRAWRRA